MPCTQCQKRNARQRGMCNACYDKWLKANNPEYAERQKASTAAWRSANSERVAANLKANHVVRKYELTREEFDKLFAEQGGKCKLCDLIDAGEGRENRLGVDHSHDTGRVRGLLCKRCNVDVERADEAYWRDNEWRNRAKLYLQS